MCKKILELRRDVVTQFSPARIRAATLYLAATVSTSESVSIYATCYTSGCSGARGYAGLELRRGLAHVRESRGLTSGILRKNVMPVERRYMLFESQLQGSNSSFARAPRIIRQCFLL